MSYTYDDFGLAKRGPQFKLLDELLTAWEFPANSLLDTPMERIKRWQRSIGNTADGLLGPRQWALLQMPPTPAPSGVVEMSKFKRTLATGKPGHPTEQTDLVDTTGPVVFRANVDGVTTSGSSYARDELREMDPEEWSSRDGKHHRMTGVFRVLEYPGRKIGSTYTPGVIPAQIHDDADDVMILLVDINGRVIVEEGLGKGNGSKPYELFTGYKLGDPLAYVIDAHAGGIDVTVNGRHINIPKQIDDAYFKAGVYNRGNTSNATGAGSVAYDALGTLHR